MNKKALVIGIDNYPIKPLSGCVNDARAVAQLFARHGNGEPNFDVELITAPQANADGTIPQPDDPETENSPKGGITKAVLGRKILDLFNNGNPDIALFYFSGHGMITSIGGLILTSDFQDWSEGIPMNDLLAYANQSKAREKIIILDCCHSGAFGTPGADGKCEISEGMVVLSAAMPAQEAIEEKGHGIFTSLLAEALDGAAADLLGQVTPGAIYHYVDQALGSWEQRPIFKTNVTSWTSLRNVLRARAHRPSRVKPCARSSIISLTPNKNSSWRRTTSSPIPPMTMAKLPSLRTFRHLPPATWLFPLAKTTCTGPP